MQTQGISLLEILIAWAVFSMALLSFLKVELILPREINTQLIKTQEWLAVRSLQELLSANSVAEQYSLYAVWQQQYPHLFSQGASLICEEKCYFSSELGQVWI